MFRKFFEALENNNFGKASQLVASDMVFCECAFFSIRRYALAAQIAPDSWDIQVRDFVKNIGIDTKHRRTMKIVERGVKTNQVVNTFKRHVMADCEFIGEIPDGEISTPRINNPHTMKQGIYAVLD